MDVRDPPEDEGANEVVNVAGHHRTHGEQRQRGGVSLPEDEKERPGSQTSALPSTGSTETKAVTTPHSAAFGMPTRRI